LIVADASPQGVLQATMPVRATAGESKMQTLEFSALESLQQ
jgi:hypothetical protein